ncbi:MAG: hypothetical protein KAH54_04755 [Candidatus Sabulitectum sp.]|nr:hypothetical protein [Candidatus Sabulitectum sp.]
MKSRNKRAFWTALGSRLLDGNESTDTADLPVEMKEALALPLKAPEVSTVVRGEDLEGKRGRNIYMYTWKILRELGFSRPLRCEVFPGIELFLPFVKGTVTVLPQGFQKRIPLSLRAYALVGKNAALRAKGFHLVIVAAIFDETTWDTLKQGGCRVCTPDKLEQLLTALDLPQ